MRLKQTRFYNAYTLRSSSSWCTTNAGLHQFFAATSNYFFVIASTQKVFRRLVR
jgi:hypothetical protein